MNAVNEHSMVEHTIQAWCLGISGSIKHQDIDTHMQLVSKRVQVYGMPTTKSINYRQWEARRKFEFDNNEILSLNFKDTHLISSTHKRIRFSTNQTMLGTDGKMVLLDKNITLELEENQMWRVIEEKVNAWQVKKIDMDSF